MTQPLKFSSQIHRPEANAQAVTSRRAQAAQTGCSRVLSVVDVESDCRDVGPNSPNAPARRPTER